MSTQHFKISKPTTSEDKGSPSHSCEEDVKRILRFIEDERHLVAHTLYLNVLKRIQEVHEKPASEGGKRLRLRPSKSSKTRFAQAKDTQAAEELVEEHQAILEKLQQRCRLFAQARENLLDDHNWTLAQTLFGITTYYRREDDGSLSIKMEGRIEGVPLFDQVAVLREVDLHYKWAPFVSSSLTIAHLDKLDTVGWFVVGVPSFGIMRDACFRAIGCDSMLEDGSILLVAQGLGDKPEDGVTNIPLQQSGNSNGVNSVPVMEASEFEYLSKDPILEDLDLPSPPGRNGSGRITIRAFQSLIHVESPKSAMTRMITNIDPNLPLIPQSLLDFIMKKLCGILLYKLQGAAKKVSKDPVSNPHASKMRAEEEFYKFWLMEKFQAVCKLRDWTMPPVSSFELSDQQMELAQAADEKKHKSRTNKTLRFYHSLSEDKLDEYLEEKITLNGSEPRGVGQKTPKVRASPTEEDSISDISRSSSSTFSFWQKNPISHYLREAEEKAHLEKAKEVERSRKRAADRLKPKSLDEDALHRLKELRLARKRRAAGFKLEKRPQILDDATQSQRKLIEAEHKKTWVTTLTSHGFMTRLIVMSFLILSLFGILHLDKSLAVYLTNRFGLELTGIWRDAAVVGYMVMAAIVHFMVCYVSLMYSFVTLQLGSIAGGEVKGFYSKNIHLVVGTSSAGMVVLGMVKASIEKSIRWIFWQMSLLLEVARGFFPDPILGRVQEIKELSCTIWKILSSGLLESNFIGRSVSTAVLKAAQPIIVIKNGCDHFIESSIDHFEGKSEIKSWRDDAYQTTRGLLIYSGVFLFVLLILFNIQANSLRKSVSERVSQTRDADHCIASSADNQTGTTSSSALAERKNGEEHSPLRTNSRSLASAFETIEEGSDEGIAVAEQATSIPSHGNGSKKWKRRGLFRGRKQERKNGS